MRWKVGIAGQPAVLHQLAIVVSNDDMRLDAHDGLAFLSGARLDALEDAVAALRERAGPDSVAWRYGQPRIKHALGMGYMVSPTGADHMQAPEGPA